MKKMKKFLAMLLALTMVLGMAVTANAADAIIGNKDDTGSITVEGISTDETVNVEAYPIVLAEYDSKGNFSGYHNIYNLADMENPTLSELSAIAANPTYGQKKILEKTGDVYTKDELAVGMYLIKVTGSDAKVYNPAVASINYVNPDNNDDDLGDGNDITNGSVEMVTAIKDGYAYVKQSSVPTIDKNFSGSTNDGNTLKIGETVSYEVVVTPIPSYTGNNPKLEVEDTLSKGLTFKEETFAVRVEDLSGNKLADLKENVDYTFSKKTVEGKTVLTVNFVVGGVYKLNGTEDDADKYVGQKVVITYDALLNTDANVNEIANTNEVELTYTKDSTVIGNDGTAQDTTYTYTFELDAIINGQTSTEGIITKTGDKDEDGDTKIDPLAGAVFGLYTAETCAPSELYTNAVFEGTATSSTTGQLHIKGLAAGTYWLKEISAPKGYSVNTHAFKIEIGATYYDDGQLKNWNVKVDGNEIAVFTIGNEGAVTPNITGAPIQNTKLINLPSTGGIGTTIFTVAGCGIMIAAAFFFFASRKKENE